MKKKIIALGLSAFLFCGFTSNAQKSSAMLRAGFNLANVSINSDGSIDDAKMLPSFHVGLIGDLPITGFFSVQTGLLFSGKGTKTQFGNTTDANYYRAKTNPFYIELPVNAVVKLPLDDDSKFFFGAGPYAAMGIGGKNKAEGKIFGVAFESKENIKWSNDDPTTSGEEGAGLGIMRRFDYGLNGTAGIEGRSVVFSVNYGFGLAKLQSGTDNNADNNNKHRILSVALGFKL
ncbi:MAG: porin family protein [Chitinophagaceae bacterium]|nr:porin family protein [Chitinophagaceae bacterium]